MKYENMSIIELKTEKLGYNMNTVIHCNECNMSCTLSVTDLIKKNIINK